MSAARMNSIYNEIFVQTIFAGVVRKHGEIFDFDALSHFEIFQGIIMKSSPSRFDPLGWHVEIWLMRKALRFLLDCVDYDAQFCNQDRISSWHCIIKLTFCRNRPYKRRLRRQRRGTTWFQDTLVCTRCTQWAKTVSYTHLCYDAVKNRNATHSFIW